GKRFPRDRPRYRSCPEGNMIRACRSRLSARFRALLRRAGLHPRAFACAGLMLTLMSAVASAQTPQVQTDKPDYIPGESVVVTGSGWTPGEAVDMLIHETPMAGPDLMLTSIAD